MCEYADCMIIAILLIVITTLLRELIMGNNFPATVSTTDGALNISIPHDILTRHNWYYKMELAPGFFTPGRGFGSAALPRYFLNNLDLHNCDVLDYGCMEGLFSVIMHRKGAKSVVACDIDDLSDSISLVRNAYKVPITYFPGIRHDGIVGTLMHANMMSQRRTGADGRHHVFDKPGFDFINFSGVMYHTVHPLIALMQLRTLLRPGGLMIVETAVINTMAYGLFYNFQGEQKIYPGNDTWFYSPPLLDHMLRMLHLLPIDVMYLPKVEQGQAFRCAILCRAIDSEPMLDNEDATNCHHFNTNPGYYDYVDFDFNADTPAQPLNYTPLADNFVPAVYNKGAYIGCNVTETIGGASGTGAQ